MTSRLRHAALALACAALMTAPCALAQSTVELGFTTRVSAALIAQMAAKFTAAARDFLASWLGFSAGQKQPPFMQRLEASTGREAEVLQAVNDYFNRIRYREDTDHWRQLDYWATPAESVASNGGDCEDYSIAKYYLLKELGVPLERLRITYVKALRQNQAHMVLAYYPKPRTEPLILDNLDVRVLPASQRKDLVPVYSFNDDDLQMAQGNLRSKPSQIRAWLSVQERLLEQSRI